MSVIDSFVEGWQTSKLNDGRWQTIPDESDSFSGKMTSENQRHICQEIEGSTPLSLFPPLRNLLCHVICFYRWTSHGAPGGGLKNATGPFSV